MSLSLLTSYQPTHRRPDPSRWQPVGFGPALEHSSSSAWASALLTPPRAPCHSAASHRCCRRHLRRASHLLSWNQIWPVNVNVSQSNQTSQRECVGITVHGYSLVLKTSQPHINKATDSYRAWHRFESTYKAYWVGSGLRWHFLGINLNHFFFV